MAVNMEPMHVGQKPGVPQLGATPNGTQTVHLPVGFFRPRFLLQINPSSFLREGRGRTPGSPVCLRDRPGAGTGLGVAQPRADARATNRAPPPAGTAPGFWGTLCCPPSGWTRTPALPCPCPCPPSPRLHVLERMTALLRVGLGLRQRRQQVETFLPLGGAARAMEPPAPRLPFATCIALLTPVLAQGGCWSSCHRGHGQSGPGRSVPSPPHPEPGHRPLLAARAGHAGAELAPGPWERGPVTEETGVWLWGGHRTRLTGP